MVGLATVETFRQLKQYAEEGYPRKPYVEGGPGLVEGEWHLRDLEAPEGEALGTGWYEEFLKWRHIHRRDQLSFNYVAWKLGTSALRGFKYVSTKLAGAVPFDASHMLKRADHLRRPLQMNLLCKRQLGHQAESARMPYLRPAITGKWIGSLME